jgi:proteasome beta subunit
MRNTNLDPYESEIAPDTNNYSDNDEDTVAKTGTTTIGITTTDGVVIATDRRASLGGKFVSSKDIVKVEQIQPQTGMTLVGSVGGAQDFIKQMRAEASLYEARRREQMSVSSIASVARGLARRGPFRAINPIIGGVDDTGSHVFTIDPAGGCIEDDYAVTGSGMMVAHGKLEDEYYDEITNEEARALAGQAIQAAAERDAGSGNGLVLCTITEDDLSIEKYADYSIVDEL